MAGNKHLNPETEYNSNSNKVIKNVSQFSNIREDKDKLDNIVVKNNSILA